MPVGLPLDIEVIDMTYLIKFDENGRKDETYPMDDLMTDEEKQSLINRGFIEVTEDDFDLYIQTQGGKNKTGYIRGKDGKPTDAPPYVPTKGEKTLKLYNECVKDLKAIDNDIIQAIAANDEEFLADLRIERQERIEQYQRDLEELEW